MEHGDYYYNERYECYNSENSVCAYAGTSLAASDEKNRNEKLQETELRRLSDKISYVERILTLYERLKGGGYLSRMNFKQQANLKNGVEACRDSNCKYCYSMYYQAAQSALDRSNKRYKSTAKILHRKNGKGARLKSLLTSSSEDPIALDVKKTLANRAKTTNENVTKKQLGNTNDIACLAKLSEVLTEPSATPFSISSTSSSSSTSPDPPSMQLADVGNGPEMHQETQLGRSSHSLKANGKSSSTSTAVFADAKIAVGDGQLIKKYNKKKASDYKNDCTCKPCNCKKKCLVRTAATDIAYPKQPCYSICNTCGWSADRSSNGIDTATTYGCCTTYTCLEVSKDKQNRKNERKNNLKKITREIEEQRREIDQLKNTIRNSLTLLNVAIENNKNAAPKVNEQTKTTENDISKNTEQFTKLKKQRRKWFNCCCRRRYVKMKSKGVQCNNSGPEPKKAEKMTVNYDDMIKQEVVQQQDSEIFNKVESSAEAKLDEDAEKLKVKKCEAPCQCGAKIKKKNKNRCWLLRLCKYCC